MPTPLDIKQVLADVVKRGASDLHLTEGQPPMVRINGDLMKTDFPTMNREEMKSMIYGILNNQQKVQFEEELELDFSLYIPQIARFRVNIHMQRGSVEAAFRVIPFGIRSLTELGLPPVVAELGRKPTGLILVTGATGMGKSTTLASILDLINAERDCVAVTIEDPIEYVHQNKRSIIKQREVGADTRSFSNALKHALRQDPNVIMVGEMRDLETISTAITAAETGHLVLSTLHTPDASQTIDRLIDIYPPHQQNQVKIQLSGCLEAVIAQQLLPRKDKQGRVLATEILIATSAIRSLIRDHKTEQLPTMIQTGGKYGMKSMDKSLKELYQQGLITLETALQKAKHPEEFKQL